MNEKIIERIKSITLEDVVVRLLSAWAIMGFFQNLVIKDKKFFTTNFFFEKYTPFGCGVVFVLFFIALCLPIFKGYEKKILWASFFLLFLRTLWQTKAFGFYLGAVLIMIILTLYAFKDSEFKRDINKPVMFGVIAIFTALVSALILTVTILMYKAFWTPTYDFGIFSQMFYYMKETLLPLSTCERDKLLSHFAVHFSPIFYLLLPAYFVFPSPVTLLVGQVVISASGLIPLYLLCRKYKHSNLCTAFLCLCYMGIPAITGANLYYLHENVFLSPLLLWLFYFCEKENLVGSVIFAILVMLVKEDAPIYIIIFGLYLLISKKNKKLGVILAGLGLVYFATALGLLKAFGEGAMVGRFDNFNKSGEPTTLVGVIITAFSNPAYVISECFENDRILFLMQFFIPLMFLPFITRKYSRYILLAPVLIVNLLSDYGYQHDMGYQYVFGPLAFVIYLCVMNSADIERKKRSKLLLISALASVLVFMSMYYERFEIRESYEKNLPEHEAIAQALELIPDDASVCASTFLVANLSQRNEIYELESTKNEAEYYVLDLRYETQSYNVEDYKQGGYEEIYLDKFIGIFKKII